MEKQTAHRLGFGRKYLMLMISSAFTDELFKTGNVLRFLEYLLYQNI